MSISHAMHSNPEDIEQAFYEALEAGDLEALMDLWADDEQVVCIHPGGPRVEGFQDVRESWREVLSAGGLQIRAAPLQKMIGGVVAVHNVVEQVVLGDAMGEPEVIQVNVTNVFHNGPAGWKLVMHHASPASDIEEIEGEEALAEVQRDFDTPPTLH